MRRSLDRTGVIQMTIRRPQRCDRDIGSLIALRDCYNRSKRGFEVESAKSSEGVSFTVHSARVKCWCRCRVLVMVSEEFEVIVHVLFPTKTLDRFSKRDLTGSDWKVHEGEGESTPTVIRGTRICVLCGELVLHIIMCVQEEEEGKETSEKGLLTL